MILSHRWRFIFIKGRKVAGTSVEMALSTLCGPEDIVTPITPRDEVERFRAGGQARNFAWSPIEELQYRSAIAQFAASGSDRFDQVPSAAPILSRYSNHMSLAEVLSRFGGPRAGYQAFCVERSPYSKALSWANMQESYAAYAEGGNMRAARGQLAGWMDRVIADGSVVAPRNIDLYRDHDGRLSLRVLRYADLPGALHEFLAGLGAPAPALPHAKKGLMADTLDPREVLRPDQIERLNELYREEFETFGYPMLEP